MQDLLYRTTSSCLAAYGSTMWYRLYITISTYVR